MRALLAAAALSAVLQASTAQNATDIVMQGINPGKPNVAYVFIQGADITPSAYVPLFQALQAAASDYNLWIGAPAAQILNSPNPLEMASDVARIMGKLQGAGLNLPATPVLYGAHSLGGTMIQLFLQNLTSVASYGSSTLGVTLFGSFLLRYVRAADGLAPFTVPTLTMVGELDGLARVSRFAEAWWHQQYRAGSPALAAANPVIVVEGMNHGQFASGQMPPFVELFDLSPEIDETTAHVEVAATVADYLETLLNGPAAAQAAARMSDRQANTTAFLAPLVSAFELEGYYYFLPPCYDQTPAPNCTTGNKHSEWAQSYMAGVAPATVVDTDAFHPVDQTIPTIHLPEILNNCTAPTAACTLQTTTVTENSYELGSQFDTAIVPVGAAEMRVKMRSRQMNKLAAGFPVGPETWFNITDAPDICAEINNETYVYVQSSLAAPKALQRFLAKGIPFIFGADHQVIAGPTWIWGQLSFANVTDPATGGVAVQINSTALKTPNEYFIPLAAAMHYCKVLSPARALEWIMVDSLRTGPILLPEQLWDNTPVAVRDFLALAQEVGTARAAALRAQA